MAEIRLRLREADGGLPDVCMRCGEPSTVVKTKKMSWHPSWVIFTIFIAWPLYIILALVFTKRAVVQAPLCDQHKGHWFYRTMIIVGTLFLFAVVVATAFFIALALGGQGRQANDNAAGIGCVLGAVLGLIWLIILVAAQNTAIRPKEITDRDITLAGLAQEFVDAVEDQDYDDRPRRRRSRDDDDDAPRTRKKPPPLDDDDDDIPKPRKKRPSSDAIEEA